MSSVDEVIENLKKCQTENEAKTYIEMILPGWLVNSFREYCEDYGWLTRNWNFLCEQRNTTPKLIVLVTDIDFSMNDRDILIRRVCDYLTLNGYIVRRQNEFVACTVCGKAIPDSEIYAAMRDKGAPVPAEWSDRCSSHPNTPHQS